MGFAAAAVAVVVAVAVGVAAAVVAAAVDRFDLKATILILLTSLRLHLGSSHLPLQAAVDDR